ncbi:IS110 family transposase, partial [Streptococcus pasteurianus]
AFKAYFKTKLAQGKHYNVAISHVAKKLIRVLFYLLKNNETFDEDKLR